MPSEFGSVDEVQVRLTYRLGSATHFPHKSIVVNESHLLSRTPSTSSSPTSPNGIVNSVRIFPIFVLL